MIELDDEEQEAALMRALEKIHGNGRSARFEKGLDDERRPRGFMIEIGLLPPDDEKTEEEELDEGGAPGYPMMG